MWYITLIYRAGGEEDARNFTYKSETKPTHVELFEAIQDNGAYYAIVEQEEAK